MKSHARLLSLLLCFLMLSACFVSCGTPNETETDLPSSDVTTESESVTETQKETEKETETDPVLSSLPETLKILAIGNSFAIDATEHLCEIALRAGVKNVVIGTLYISGCSIDTHYETAKSNVANYSYRKNVNGSSTVTKEVCFKDVIADEDWDYITLQQVSQLSGIASSYENLEALVAIINEQKTNADAKIFWHMTWAYQQNSTYSGFVNYGHNQTEMYQCISETAIYTVLPTNCFDGLIPSGTAIQNARTSFIGDNLTRDGYHLTLGLGRYIAGLTYFAAITGADLSAIPYYIPSAEFTGDVLHVAIESVENAIKSNFVPTESKIKTGLLMDNTSQNAIIDTAACFESDSFYASTIGVDLSDYVLLSYVYLTNQYYQADKKTGTISPTETSSTYEKFICTADKYSKQVLLNAVIICDSGWQYRPDKFPDKSTLVTNRVPQTSTPVLLLDEAWWGSDTYVGINICSSPQSNISDRYEAASTHVRIYVPKK